MDVGKITNRERFGVCETLTFEKIKAELDFVVSKIDANMERFKDAYTLS